MRKAHPPPSHRCHRSHLGSSSACSCPPGKVEAGAARPAAIACVSSRPSRSKRQSHRAAGWSAQIGSTRRSRNGELSGPLRDASVALAGVLRSSSRRALSRCAAIRWVSPGDEPNERSLHSVPTPRLGGIGVMAGTLPVAALFAGDSLGVVLGCAAALALVSLADDLRSLPIEVRLPAHFAAALLTVLVIAAPAGAHSGLGRGRSPCSPWWASYG